MLRPLMRCTRARPDAELVEHALLWPCGSSNRVIGRHRALVAPEELDLLPVELAHRKGAWRGARRAPAASTRPTKPDEKRPVVSIESLTDAADLLRGSVKQVVGVGELADHF